jgi:hypothetical protein
MTSTNEAPLGVSSFAVASASSTARALKPVYLET